MTALALDPVAAPASPPGPLTFDEVYEDSFDFVWRTVRRFGVADEQAEDVTQEVFVVVHRKLDAFEGRSDVRTWLYGIARRVARDHRRSAARRRSQDRVPVPEGLADDAAEWPDARFAQRERAALLASLLAQLDETKRETLVLAELEEMTAREIAEAMGTKESTVYTRLHEARKAFNRIVRRHRARERRGR